RPASAVRPATRRGAEQLADRPATILQFPDDIPRPVRAPRAVPVAQSAGAPASSWVGVDFWSLHDVRGRAEVDRTVYLRTLVAQAFASAKSAVVRRPEMFGCVVLAATLAALVGAKSFDLLGFKECRSDLVALARGGDAGVTMTVPAGGACSLWIKPTMAA